MTNEQLTRILDFHKDMENGTIDYAEVIKEHNMATLSLDRLTVLGYDTADTKEYINELNEIISTR